MDSSLKHFLPWVTTHFNMPHRVRNFNPQILLLLLCSTLAGNSILRTYSKKSSKPLESSVIKFNADNADEVIQINLLIVPLNSMNSVKSTIRLSQPKRVSKQRFGER